MPPPLSALSQDYPPVETAAPAQEQPQPLTNHGGGPLEPDAEKQ